MKRFLLSISLLTVILAAKAQLNTGDLAFTGFCADGNDNLALAAFADIPANTTIYFCDSEWNGTSFGTDENDVIWNTGSDIIPAGTIITIDNVSNGPTINYGSLTGQTGFSSSGEAVFVYLGTAVRQPTTFLTAISNSNSGFGILDGTGLQLGLTAIGLAETADIAAYNGPRSGLDQGGYLALMGNMANWDIQDTGGDDHIDGNTPDLPFSSDSFNFVSADNTPPFVTSVEVTSATTIDVFYSEELENGSATDVSNYSFEPVINILSVNYNSGLNKATVTHEGFASAVSTTISISGVLDLAGNVLEGQFVSAPFFYNPEIPQLIITEIMYNAGVSFGNDLEFIEIYNAGTSIASLGGIQVMDAGNFVFTFPQMNLDPGAIILLASNKEVADTFYGVTFIDMAASSGNFLGNGGELLQILNGDGELIFSVNYDDASPWSTVPDGGGPSLELLNSTYDANDGTSWIPSSNFISNVEGKDIFASPGTFVEFTTSYVSFAEEFTISTENAVSISISVELNVSPISDASVDLVLGAFNTANEGVDFVFENTPVTFDAFGNTSVSVSIPVIDNFVENPAKLFTLRLENFVNCEAGAITETVIYILNDETSAPTGTDALDIEHVHSFQVDPNGSAEIVAFNKVLQRLYVLNSVGNKLEILNFSNPRNITAIATVDLSAYGSGATSVACNNHIVVVTVDGFDNEPGHAVVMNSNGSVLQVLEAGHLPDMVSITSDNKKIVIANEGEPTADYSFDPEGSITVIDLPTNINNLGPEDVHQINFNDFDDDIETLKADGVRIFGLNSTVSQDFEPEYITHSRNSKIAWVTLQENNAIAEIDLLNYDVNKIIPLGTKDHSQLLNGLDASDRIDSIVIANWPVRGMYLPDAIASYKVGATEYVVTANEGDQREYQGIDEDVAIGNDEYVLDSLIFPNAGLLKQDHMLGRLKVTPYNGDTDGDGDFDEIHVFGSRSFSIWNTATGDQVYDSGDDFEQITAADPVWGSLFNVSNDNNNFKNRSDNKGPEPEGITVAKIKNKHYAFVTLERTGGFMAYDITNPLSPEFVTYSNNRTLGDNEGGDLGPEGIIYIGPGESPSDTALVVMANEVSATISVYYINNMATPKNLVDHQNPGESIAALTKSTTEISNEIEELVIYPNPVSGEKIYFSLPLNFALYDATGKLLMNAINKASLDISGFAPGIYIIKSEDGQSKHFVIE